MNVQRYSSPGRSPGDVTWQRFGTAASVLCLIGSALALRGYAASFQLWLDEIWALQASRSVRTIADLFSGAVLDGHFSLYTVWLGAFSAGTPEVILRAPALVGGAVQLIGTWFLARRWWGDGAATWATLLGSVSFFFLIYGTEARSYGVVGGCAVVAVLLAERYARAPSVLTAALFAVVVAGGALFHLTFIPFYAVFALVDLIATCRTHGVTRGVGRSLGLHLAPATALLVLLGAVAPTLGQGSGPIVDYIDTFVDSVALIAGGPLVSPSSVLQTALALGMAFVVLIVLGRAVGILVSARDSHVILLSALALGIPLLTAVVAPRVFLPRYLYLAVWAAYLLLARAADRATSGGGWRSGRGAVACGVAIVIVAGNLWSSARFVSLGRGDLRGAIEAACALGAPEQVVIGGTHEFRDRMVIDSFAPRVCGGRTVTYISLERGVAVNAMLIQSQDTAFRPPPHLEHGGEGYAFVAAFPYAGLSGWGWYLYRPEIQR